MCLLESWDQLSESCYSPLAAGLGGVKFMVRVSREKGPSFQANAVISLD